MLQFAVECEYLKKDDGTELFRTYHEVLSMLVAMINSPEKWILYGQPNDNEPE